MKMFREAIVIGTRRTVWRVQIQSSAAGVAMARGVLFVIVTCCIGGCGARTPPPPPVPVVVEQPAPPPPPPEASEADVAAWLRPFFFVLFDRGFCPATVDAPGRYPVVFADDRISAPSGRQLTPPLEKSLSDAKGSTPTLQDLVSEQLRGGGANVGSAVVAWHRQLQAASQDSDTSVSGRVARRCVQGMYVAQALADAEAQKFHRAHVLLSDVSRVLGADNDFGEAVGFADFRRFFTEVPDEALYEAFARRLESYVRAREELLLVSGEDAAILHAAGMNDAAAFMKDKLTSRFTLIILPLIDAAIVRGEGYGFAPPKGLAELRRRLVRHADALKGDGKTESRDAYRTDAIKVESAEGSLRQLDTLAKLVGDGGGTAADGSSVEKAVRSLQAGPRSVGDWIREKVLCAVHCPLYLVKPGDSSVVVEVGRPLVYATDKESLDMLNLSDLSAGDGGESLANLIRSWCSGESLADPIAAGAAHYLLAWYWLELERPQLARMALLGGAKHLLGVAKAADIERLRTDPGQNASAIIAALQAELNAYRMLLAAAAITSAPPGAPTHGGDSSLAELQVLTAAWRQAWLKCGLPEEVANDAVRRVDADCERIASIRVTPQRERYHFFDYRFGYGAVPDVVVKRACEQGLFDADGKLRGGEAGMTAFVKSFDLPNEFSKGAKRRWGSP